MDVDGNGGVTATLRGTIEQVEVREPANNPIPHELHRIADTTEVVLARLAQLEDRLGPVRMPFDRVGPLAPPEVATPTSPIAETLRQHVAKLEGIAYRIDEMLGDIEL